MTAPVTLLCCVRHADAPALEARIATAIAALPDGAAHEVLVMGHGRSGALAPMLRELQRRHADWRIVLQTRPTSARAALAAALEQVRTPAVVRA